MFECLILGDSIAVGIGQNRPTCHVQAKVGITTKNWLRTYGHNSNFYKVVVISLSTNDYNFDNIEEYLYDVRIKNKANMVVWILPNPVRKPVQHALVKKIAVEFGDRTLDITQYLGPDGIHPTVSGYKTIAQKF